MSQIIQTFNKNTVLYLSLIITLGFIIRFYYFPYEIPISNDGYFSFIYSVKTVFEGNLPIGYTTTNTGWSNFLSLIFLISDKSNPEFLMNIQRVCSVTFSVITVIPGFFIFKRFFHSNLALLPCLLLILEPRLLLVSLDGLNFSFYIFLFVTIIALFLKYTTKSLVICFILLGIITLVRYEGLILIFPLTVFYFIKSKNKKEVFRYLILLSIFLIILFSVTTLRIDATENICYITKTNSFCGQDGIFSNFIGIIDFYDRYILSGEQISEELNSSYDIHRDVYNKPGEIMIGYSLLESFSRLIKFIGLSLIPIFFILLPISIFFIIKNKKQLKINPEIKFMIFTSSFMLLPSIYAYTRGIDEIRYVLILIPLFCIISLLFFKNLIKYDKINTKIILIIFIMILCSSIIFIEYKKPDYTFERESVKISEEILSLTNSMNAYPSSGYVKATKLVNMWPELPLPVSDAMGKIKNPYGTLKLSTEKFTTIEEFVMESKKLGIEYIVVEQNDSFFNDLRENPKKYVYLEKIFDSKESNFVHIFDIYKLSL